MVGPCNKVATSDLKADLLPGRDADPGAIWQSALTFDGYRHYGSFERCAEIANRAQNDCHARGTLPVTLTDLRGCLFFEQRRWRHCGYYPGKASEAYVRALVEAIREKVKAAELE